MKRNGLLLKNVLSVLLAVVGILIFIVGIYRLYQVGVNEESESAKSTLNLVIERINALPDRQMGTFAVQGFSKNPWYLSGWSKLDRAKPEKCLGVSCLCICKDSGRAAACQGADGFCHAVDFNNVSVLSTSIESPTNGAVSSGTGAPGVPSGAPQPVKRKCVPLVSSLQEISISVIKGDTLLLTGESGGTSNPGSPWVSTYASVCEVEP